MRRLPPAWRALAPVMLTSTLVGMTFSLAMPLLSLSLERAGVDSLTIGLNTAIGGFGIFLVAPFVQPTGRDAGCRGLLPPVLGRLGRLHADLSLLGRSMVLGSAVRLLFGCAGSLMFVLSEAAVNALTPEAIRGRVLGIYATLFSLGFVSGPLVLAVAGSEGWAPFLLGSAMFLLGSAAGLPAGPGQGPPRA